MKLAEIFQDGMVLQRDYELHFFGENEIERVVTVQIDGMEAVKVNIPAGSFSITIPPQKTAWNATIEFVDKNGVLITLRHIRFGEVWLAGGQSNMELPMLYDREFRRLKKAKLSERIFFYEVPKRYAPIPETRKINKQGRWLPCTPETLDRWAAVPYYFANQLSDLLPDCPIGVVSCNFGGSNLLCWLPKEIVEGDAALRPFYRAYEEHCSQLDRAEYEAHFLSDLSAREKPGFRRLVGEMYLRGKFPPIISRMRWKGNQEPLPSQKDFGPWDSNRPCGLYESMFSTIIGTVFRGVIWYQGESEANAERAPLYTHTMELLVSHWRKVLGAQLPFMTVVLPRFECDIMDNGVLFPEIRNQQRALPEQIDNLYTVEDFASGTAYNVHSPHKRGIGEKLAQESVKVVYSPITR